MACSRLGPIHDAIFRSVSATLDSMVILCSTASLWHPVCHKIIPWSDSTHNRIPGVDYVEPEFSHAISMVLCEGCDIVNAMQTQVRCDILSPL